MCTGIIHLIQILETVDVTMYCNVRECVCVCICVKRVFHWANLSGDEGLRCETKRRAINIGLSFRPPRFRNSIKNARNPLARYGRADFTRLRTHPEATATRTSLRGCVRGRAGGGRRRGAIPRGWGAGGFIRGVKRLFVVEIQRWDCFAFVVRRLWYAFHGIKLKTITPVVAFCNTF